ncbi:hypothetical protein SAMN02745126_05452 [Enhydrobacter aerosaccus]|uniref:Uncharacterized protein n=1 Tax=Enhydrobacter aerosaccus TaxID=225324 RepID=A0A1T4T0R6_9HYPH|nr:hypothetical protein [Enhydrobacter aerosaccus]SKA34007.1 hypothetical protein SAMN02745126_05452 [Enhydrobacter aerosaccus]
MRTILGWSVKLSIAGLLYVALSSGSVHLPETVLGYRVPDSARQWVDRNAQIADFGRQTQASFKGLADAIK